MLRGNPVSIVMNKAMVFMTQSRDTGVLHRTFRSQKHPAWTGIGGWGWETIHDGWEFRSQAERGLCTAHVSAKSMVVHSMHTTADFELVRRELREACDAKCQAEPLPFTVDGLKDLCGRNANIPKVYSRCANVGHPPADEPGPPLPSAAPRPRCHSVGQNVAFIAAKEEGGTITCDDRPGFKL